MNIYEAKLEPIERGMINVVLLKGVKDNSTEAAMIFQKNVNNKDKILLTDDEKEKLLQVLRNTINKLKDKKILKKVIQKIENAKLISTL